MNRKQVQTLARLLAVVALLLLVVRASWGNPPENYVYRLLNPLPALAPLPMLPIYPVKKAPKVPAKKPVVKPKPAVVKPKPKPLTQAQQDARGACSVAFLRSIMWWRETQGYNRGPGINEAIRANGGTQGEEYCGDTQAAAQRSCGGYVPPASNGSYNWFLPRLGRNVLYGNTGSFDNAQIGFKAGIFNKGKGRIAHITAIAEQPITKANRNAPARGAWCLGGNEGRGVNAGVHRTWYPAANLFAIADYNK